ncbi:hypothetical protein WR164_02270 [Philodulcilactobacillus myokoensis]|uniref:TetR/AcrR family transcriptional regulator n=1 Tax=Philodulcilactobacillus myokoensis TaxID=2929573 RepID=A0A9W6B059_9LACO|nr:TetR/AcrR family transcriptional regulator [Philodulcilactobacillus myokoensis]GLB46248.1 hypothetical protein WR164_02270 [Philodulcilactobacillus myokoensis]
MPKITFKNLNSEKQDHIFNSLLKEFSKFPVSKAKVSRIIVSANIARGSFYKYFDNLEDSYRYTFDCVMQTVHADLYQEISSSPKDTLNSFYQYTKKFAKELNHSKYKDFYKLYLKYNQYYLSGSIHKTKRMKN